LIDRIDEAEKIECLSDKVQSKSHSLSKPLDNQETVLNQRLNSGHFKTPSAQ
jgi:hypothetical protein